MHEKTIDGRSNDSIVPVIAFAFSSFASDDVWIRVRISFYDDIVSKICLFIDLYCDCRGKSDLDEFMALPLSRCQWYLATSLISAKSAPKSKNKHKDWRQYECQTDYQINKVSYRLPLVNAPTNFKPN